MALIGQGLGPRMLGLFLEEVVFADPGVTGVRTSVSVANRRSWRCLEKLGFQRGPARAVTGEDGPQYVMTLSANQGPPLRAAP